MSKRGLVMVLLLLFVGVGAINAQDAAVSATEEAGTSAAISPALEQQMTTLEQITSNLRELPIQSEVDHQFPTRQETIDYLNETYQREFPPAEFDRLKQFYVALDLLPADIDLQTVYLNLLGSQVAGFYDPDTKAMNVVPTTGDDPGSSLSFSEQIVYVHEFTHALQDQYFDLNALTSSPEIADNPDRSLAITALVEGDATAVMTLYSQEVAARNPFSAFSLLIEGVQAGNLFLPEGIPPILTRELLFPYEDGLDFVVAVFGNGGWDAVDNAFKNPPTTTEQIMHPDKYIAGEGAQLVTLDDAVAALGEGWTNVWDTSLGEFYLEAHLETRLPQADARAAAAGWGGDHYRVYTSGDGQIAWALELAWDTPADQSEFETAYAQFGAAKFGSDADANGCWQSAAQALCMVTGGETLLVGAPTLDAARVVIGG